MTATPASEPMTDRADLPSTTRLLLPFALAMIAANAVLQIVIAATGSRVTLLAGLLTAVIAVAYAVFLFLRRRELGRIRFGNLASHVVVFAAVNTGFGLHLFVLGSTASSAVADDASGFFMDGGWFGAAIAMPALWGLGLLLHVVGAILDRGFEARR